MLDLLRKLARYVVTGGIAAIIDVGGFALLVREGVTLWIAAASSFAVAVLVNYGLTSRFVFAHGMNARAFTLFVISALVGLSVNVSITTAGVALMALPPVLAKVLGIGVAFFFNFAMSAGVTFRTVPRPRIVSPGQ